MIILNNLIGFQDGQRVQRPLPLFGDAGINQPSTWNGSIGRDGQA
ncbi:hypothetical protein [Desulfotruncus arcticus]|nr:hypothetical protein [Desulfotruncus arcticus]